MKKEHCQNKPIRVRMILRTHIPVTIRTTTISLIYEMSDMPVETRLQRNYKGEPLTKSNRVFYSKTNRIHVVFSLTLSYLLFKMLRRMSSLPVHLKGAALSKALQKVPLWNVLEDRSAIHRDFIFTDFKQAWDFMSKMAIVADQMQHHPEWYNVYNQVQVTLSTHDCNGLSEKVRELIL